MRSRVISTTIEQDDWFLSLPIEEQRFFLQLLITSRAEMSGIFEYPDRDFLHYMPFLSQERLNLLKKRFEADGKVFFCEGWVWVANFGRHNYFNSPQQQFSIIKQLNDLERRKPAILKYFQEKGFNMPETDEFVEKRRRNQTKKAVRKAKPWLMGQQLETEVDRVLGVADSGKMDWAAAIKKPEASDFPTVESIQQDHVQEVAKEFGLRPYKLYWFFTQKVNKLQATGRSRNDYMALLKECATLALKKELSDEEKKTAAMFWGKFIGVTVTRQQVELLMFKGEL